MSRVKRSKPNKIKIWLPIVCIVVVGITFYMIHDMQNKIEEMDIQNTTAPEENVQNEVSVNENIIEENIVEENTTQNTVANEVENETSNNVVKNTTQSQSSAPTQLAVTDQKQKAIELVKKEWGEDDSVNYSFEYINENGEYVISVKDRATATIKYYFKVNLETETVELD